MNAVCNALARPGKTGRRGERQRHEERQFCKLDQCARGGIAGQLSANRHVHKLRMSAVAAECHERPKCAFRPEIALTGAHRA
jgi:hypothetical protein